MKKDSGLKTLEKVYNSSLHLLEPMSIDQTYKVIVEEAIYLVGADYGTIFTGYRGGLKRVYSSLPNSHRVIPRKKGYTYKVYSKNKPIALAVETIARVHPEIKKTHIKSDLLIPLSYQNKVIGVMSVVSKKKNFFTERKVIILKHLAPTATLAIKQAQYFEEMQKAIDTRDLFMSMASHELKTPLTSILAYAQMLERKKNNLKEIDPKWIERLNKESKRLNKLINELLQVNQIRTGRLQYDWQEQKLHSVVQNAISNFKLNYPDRKIVFESKFTDSQDKVVADPDKILQVIINFLVNAAKFSDSASTIYVTLSEENNKVRICIRDEGKGIPRKDLPNIFEGFYRGENNTHEGMGLGLFLAKQIISTHKGKIKVSSKINKGTTFNIYLPKKI